MKRLLAMILVGVLSVSASAADWRDISDGQESMFFDRDSIKSRYDPDGNLIVSMWVLTPSDQPMMHPDGAGIMMLQSANCTDMSIKLSEMIEVDSLGDAVWRLSQDPDREEISEVLPMQYYYPAPDDNYTNNLDALCHPSTIKYGFDNAGL